MLGTELIDTAPYRHDCFALCHCGRCLESAGLCSACVYIEFVDDKLVSESSAHLARDQKSSMAQ